jgi:hypothetical protein
MCGNPTNSGKKRTITTTTTTITIPATAAKAYLSLEDFFRGLSVSERFFRHLPDFVRSRSFDHFPFSTRGTGKNFTSTVSYFELPEYIFNIFKILS